MPDLDLKTLLLIVAAAFSTEAGLRVAWPRDSLFENERFLKRFRKEVTVIVKQLESAANKDRDAAALRYRVIELERKLDATNRNRSAH